MTLISTDPRIFEEFLMNATRAFGVEKSAKSTDQKKERYLFLPELS